MVYILLGDGFEEVEALACADLLRRAELPVTLAGVGGTRITGAHGIVVEADTALEEVTPDDLEMLVLPGGLGGVQAMEASPAAVALIRRTAEEGKWLAAICAAPTLLASLGILGGRRAVCYPGMEELLGSAQVMKGQEAVVDGRLITGEGPGAAIPFALKLVEALAGADTAERVRGELHYHWR